MKPGYPPPAPALCRRRLPSTFALGGVRVTACKAGGAAVRATPSFPLCQRTKGEFSCSVLAPGMESPILLQPCPCPLSCLVLHACSLRCVPDQSRPGSMPPRIRIRTPRPGPFALMLLLICAFLSRLAAILLLFIPVPPRASAFIAGEPPACAPTPNPSSFTACWPPGQRLRRPCAPSGCVPIPCPAL